MKLIEQYKKWMKTGRMNCSGLCTTLEGEYWRTFKKWDFIPTKKDLCILADEGFDTIYWGSGLPSRHKHEMYTFTPLRQTIVLLICAIHNEL